MGASSAAMATAPDPGRHVFWARRKDQGLLTAGDPEAGGVARRPDVDQRSRCRFLCWCTLFNVLLVVGSTLLMILVQQPAAGRAVFVATRVLGYSGLAASLGLGNLLTYLWNAVATGDMEDQRMIDSFIFFFRLA